MGSIKHRKISTIPNALNDTQRIGGDDWNNEHDIDLAVEDIEGLEARLIPVDQVVQYRDDALQYRNEAGTFRNEAEGFANDAAEVVDSLAATDGATKVGTADGDTVQEALDARPTSDALAQGDGSNAIGFQLTAVGAAARTVLSKNREFVSVRDFGAVGDGVADDTVPIHNCIDFCKRIGAAAFFPAFHDEVSDEAIGIYRVTSGYVQSVIRQNVCLFGPGRTTDDTSLNLGAIILLDSTDPASFFYEAAASHQFYAHNLRFRCAQFVKDRKFWKLSNTGIVNHSFSRVAFERVEKPICYLSGSYFQSSSFTDVQFNDSGTFHSELGGNNLRGTLLTLNNVSHDGLMPDNTELTVCDFSGVRMIQGTNFLLEGTLPSAGWTVLKLNDAYDAPWSQSPTANFNGFFNEWNGFAPAYSVDQSGGRVSFSFADLRLNATSKYKMSNRAQTHISDCSFSTTDLVNDLFVIDDYKSRPIIERCLLRRSDLADERFSFINCSRAPDAGAAGEAMGAALSSNGQGTLVYKWDGGFFDADPVAMIASGGTVVTPSADTTYGRKLLMTPSGNALSAQVRVKLRGAIRQYSQFWVVALVKFPVFTGGQFAIQPIEDGVAKSGGSGYDTSYSGQTVFVCFNTRILTAATNFGVSFSTIAATGVAGDLECYTLAIYAGGAAPRAEYPSYPKNIRVLASAAPTAGAWVAGDFQDNNTPTIANPVSTRRCTVAGTPGTWAPVAWVTFKGTTAQRPTLTATDVGVGYLDTTLVAAGKHIWWSGTAWLDATGAAV